MKYIKLIYMYFIEFLNAAWYIVKNLPCVVDIYWARINF